MQTVCIYIKVSMAKTTHAESSKLHVYYILYLAPVSDIGRSNSEGPNAFLSTVPKLKP